MQEKIKNELKEAMKNRNMDRLNTLRMLSSAFTNELVYLQRAPTDVLSDEEVIKVLKRELKKRKDSVEQYNQAGRPELSREETEEAKIIEEFLPTQMTREEIKKRITEKLSQELCDPSNKGKFIGIMMKELGDTAEGTTVKEIIDELVK